MTDALYTPDGDTFHPSPLTAGPWSPNAQHGGAPAALLAGTIDRVPADSEMLLARVTVDLLRPVPLEPLTIDTEIMRPGRKVQLIKATMYHEDREVATAQGLKIRVTDLDLPFASEALPPVGPENGRPVALFQAPGAFAAEGMEIRMLEGDFSEPGPGKAWLRLRVPLVEGRETSGVERVAAAADFGNGVSNLTGDISEWVFINPDLELRMARTPSGEWVYLDSTTWVHPTGTGLATSLIGDVKGLLGVAAQSLYVDRTSP